MHYHLEWLIKWPEREELCKTMPSCFQATYGTKAVAVIDCFEVKIEIPTHLVAKSSTWSQYKHANTVKVFIAICPQGVISFISPAWGGRVSMTVNFGFLNKLLPGIQELLTADLMLLKMWLECRQHFIFHQLLTTFSHICRSNKEVSECLNTHRTCDWSTCQRYSILMSCIPIDFLKPKHPGNKPPIALFLNNLCVLVVPIE